MSNPFSRSYQRLRRVDTRLRDTVQRIAARELNDASRWPEIVQINHLIPPYLTDDPGQVVPGVYLTGTPIQIPDSGAVVTSDSASDPVTAYGIDVALVGGTLIDDGNGDFAVVSGVDNLKQALKIRIDTPLGNLLFYPLYGNGAHALRGRGNGPSVSIMASRLTQRCVKSDPRISSTQNFTVDITGDVLLVSGNAVAADGAPVDVQN